MRADVIGFLLISSLTACSVGPDYHAEQPAVPADWQAMPAQTTPIDTEALKTWWKGFGDPGLNKLMDTALAGNLDLKIAMARIEQARAERRGTRAELFPTVNATAGAQRQNNPFPGLASRIKYNLFEVGFDALWEIDLFGRQQRRLEAASADLEGANEQYRQALVTLTAEVARNYIDYRSQQRQLQITKSNLESQQQTLGLTEKLFHEGVGTRHDVVRSRAQTEATEAQLPALEASLIVNQRQLEVLLGQQPGSLDAELQTIMALPKTPAQQLLTSPAETIRQRPDIHIAERQLAAATAMQGAAVAELFPKISLSAFLGLRNTDIETLFKSAAFSYGTAANLLQPILNFGRIQAGIDLAEAKQKQAYFHYQKTVLDALQETESALTQHLKSEIRSQSLSKAVTDLQESVRLSKLSYQEGVISLLDVLDAQRSLYAAEIELTRSQTATSTNLIAVYKALGGGANSQKPST
jgi:NodT family efflux transporter outer membrane factor (OMF) lipoprotein